MNMFRLLFQKILRPPHFSPSYNAARKSRLNEKRAGAHNNLAFYLSGEIRVLSELNRPFVGVEFCRVKLPFPYLMSL